MDWKTGNMVLKATEEAKEGAQGWSTCLVSVRPWVESPTPTLTKSHQQKLGIAGQNQILLKIKGGQDLRKDFAFAILSICFEVSCSKMVVMKATIQGMHDTARNLLPISMSLRCWHTGK